jgi:glycosyltransferase involved in cell wall biosynthesis
VTRLPALLYAANLHVGGGVQAATSIISELFRLGPEQREGLSFWVSTEVHRNLVDLGFVGETLCDYRIVDHQGLGAFVSRERHEVLRYAAILVIFGPFYIRAQGVKKLVGFAQAWIIYSRTDAYALLSWPRRWLTRFKFWLQGWAFRNADQLIVELDHVRDRLVSDGIAGKRPVTVIRNCVGSVFLREGAQTVPPLVPRVGELTLGFLGRNYVHKNTTLLVQIRRVLRVRFGLSVRVLVTFTDAEWAQCDAAFRAEVENVGVVPVVDCPAYYRSLDAVIFPSLLECFSATPLEALAMEVPLFASDRSFVRDVCGDFAIYFDPHNAEEAAEGIWRYFQGPKDAEHLRKARQHVLNFSSPKMRAARLLEILWDDHSPLIDSGDKIEI